VIMVVMMRRSKGGKEGGGWCRSSHWHDLMDNNPISTLKKTLQGCMIRVLKSPCAIRPIQPTCRPSMGEILHVSLLSLCMGRMRREWCERMGVGACMSMANRSFVLSFFLPMHALLPIVLSCNNAGSYRRKGWCCFSPLDWGAFLVFLPHQKKITCPPNMIPPFIPCRPTN